MQETIDKTGEEEGPEEFIPVFKTTDLQHLELIKHFLEQNEIPYFVTGTELFHLGGLALAVEEAVLTLYSLPKDKETIQNFINET